MTLRTVAVVTCLCCGNLRVSWRIRAPHVPWDIIISGTHIPSDNTISGPRFSCENTIMATSSAKENRDGLQFMPQHYALATLVKMNQLRKNK